LRAPVAPIAARPAADVPTTMEAVWQKELRLRPFKGQHVVSLIENASVGVAGMGGFSADEIHLWLNEIPKPAGKSRSTSKTAPGGTNMQLEPDRMLATGNVRVGAEQFDGETKRLEVWFRNALPPATAMTTTTPAVSPTNPATTAAVPIAQKKKNNALPTGGTGAQKFRMLGEVVRIQLLRSGETTTLDEVSVEGGVKLWEIPPVGQTPAIVIEGASLVLRGGMEASAVVRVIGEPAAITAQGLTLRGGNVNLHRAENRLWIEGPGDMRMPLTSDLSGQKLERATNVLVGWQDNMEFNGALAHFVGDVQVQTENQQQFARADELDVTLSKKLDFAKPENGAKPEVTNIAFAGRFALENRSLDKQGQLASIDKLHAENLRIDQQTGKLVADGPGWVSTTRPAGAANPLAARGGTASPISTRAAASGTANKAPEYSYLFVEFQDQIVGQMHQRQVEFQRGVRAVYGPVDRWQATIRADLSPEQLPEQTVLM
jgi:hypothetical protein